MYLLVDPIVLYLPVQAQPNQIKHFFDNILNWNQFVKTNQGKHKFCMTEVCRYALGSAYPSRASLQNVINQTQNPVVDANTGFSVCQYLIQAFAGWPHFEKIVALPIDTFAFDVSDMRLNPDLVGRVPIEIAESLQTTFAYVAYAKEIDNNSDNNPIVSNLLFLTHPVANSNEIEIDVHLLIDDLDVDDSGEWQHAQTNLPIVGTPKDLLRHRSWTDIWEDTRQAIDLAVIFHKDNDPIPKDIQLSPYTVCPGFNDSLQNCQLPTNPNLLGQCFRKIAHLLSGKTMRNNHQLRTGPGGNNPQQEKELGENKWKAWRLRLTGGRGDAYRLHYWRSGDQYILSNVIRKNDNNVTICDIDEEVVKQIK